MCVFYQDILIWMNITSNRIQKFGKFAFSIKKFIYGLISQFGDGLAGLAALEAKYARVGSDDLTALSLPTADTNGGGIGGGMCILLSSKRVA